METPKRQYYPTQVVGVVVGRRQSIKNRVKSALDGARAGGFEVARVVVKCDDEIVLIGGKVMTEDTNTNPWDEVLINAADEKRAS